VEQRRTEILEAACQVVIERGFAGTRISDVAKRLDVSSSLIHYHFDSKEQLLAEAFAFYARTDVAEMEAEIDAAPNALGKLDRLIHNYVPEGSDDVEWMLWIDAWGEALRNPLMRSISKELDALSAALVERVLVEGVDNGEFTCADPAGTAIRLTALVDGLAIQFAAHDRIIDRSQLLSYVRAFAAHEVGVGLEAFGNQPAARHQGMSTPSAATDAALRRLLARATDALLQRDPAAFAACFTVDGLWNDGRADHQGRLAITSASAKLVKDATWVVTNIVQALFEADENAGTAVGRITLEQRLKRHSGRVIATLAATKDQYVRIDGQWLIAARQVQILDRSDT